MDDLDVLLRLIVTNSRYAVVVAEVDVADGPPLQNVRQDVLRMVRDIYPTFNLQLPSFIYTLIKNFLDNDFQVKFFIKQVAQKSAKPAKPVGLVTEANQLLQRGSVNIFVQYTDIVELDNVTKVVMTAVVVNQVNSIILIYYYSR